MSQQNSAFTEGEIFALRSLSKWMMTFIIFYIFLSAIYVTLSINFFATGFGDWGLEPKELFSSIILIIGIIALVLARELWGANKNLKKIIKADDLEEEYLAQTFVKLRKYFFIGAIFLIMFIVFLLLGFAIFLLGDL